MGDLLPFDQTKNRPTLQLPDLSKGNTCSTCIYKSLLIQVLPLVNKLSESLPMSNQYCDQRKNDKIIRELLNLFPEKNK